MAAGRTGGMAGRRPGRIAAALAVTLLLSPAPAWAQAQGAAGEGAGAFDGVLRAFNLKAKPASPPDFVRESRPASTDFIPVGRPHPGRSEPVMTPAEAEAAALGLDKDRIAQQRRAGVAAPPVPLKGAKPPARAQKSKDR